MKFFDHKDLGNHLLQLCPKVVKHPVCRELISVIVDIVIMWYQVDTCMCLEFGNNCWRAGWLGFGSAAGRTTTFRLLAGVIFVATKPRPVLLRTAFDSVDGSRLKMTPLPIPSAKDKVSVAHHLCFLYKAPERDTKMLLWERAGSTTRQLSTTLPTHQRHFTLECQKYRPPCSRNRFSVTRPFVVAELCRSTWCISA